MSANRIHKQETIDLVRDRFGRATSAVFLDFTGVDVEAITALRVSFRKAGVEYRVVKNNLVKQALKGTSFEGSTDLAKNLKGATGIAWSYEDPSVAAKVLKEAKKTDPEKVKWSIKCGVLDTQFLSGKRVEDELANLPGKDEMRAMLLATLQAPAQSLVRQLNAAGQNLVYVLGARERQQGG